MADIKRVICEDCRHWDGSSELAEAQPGTTGQCRVNPPKLDKRSGKGLWPYTEDSDWCRMGDDGYPLKDELPSNRDERAIGNENSK